MKLSIDFFVERRLGDPWVKIIIDDYITLCDGPAQDNYNFDINIPDGAHDLKITHYKKTVNDHVLDEQGNISIDKHIEIKSIIMDCVNLQKELWAGRFFPVYMHKPDNEPYFIQPNLYLGHNGTWQLEFVTPTTTWLINLRQPGPDLTNTIFQTNQEILDQAKNFFRDLPDV